MTGYIINHFEL